MRQLVRRRKSLDQRSRAVLLLSTSEKLLPFQNTRYRVHTVFEKSLKVLEFWFWNSRPLKVLKNRVRPWEYWKRPWLFVLQCLKNSFPLHALNASCWLCSAPFEMPYCYYVHFLLDKISTASTFYVLHAVDFVAWKIIITVLESSWKVLEFFVSSAVWRLKLICYTRCKYASASEGSLGLTFAPNVVADSFPPDAFCCHQPQS